VTEQSCEVVLYNW